MHKKCCEIQFVKRSAQGSGWGIGYMYLRSIELAYLDHRYEVLEVRLRMKAYE